MDPSIPFCPRSDLPSEASPSVPLHFVEREGPEIQVFLIRQDRLSYVPPLHAVEGGGGGEASEGRTPQRALMPGPGRLWHHSHTHHANPLQDSPPRGHPPP